MEIKDLISGQNDRGQVEIGKRAIPVSALKKLIEEGYVHIEPDQEKKTILLWGATRGANLYLNDLIEKYGKDSPSR